MEIQRHGNLPPLVVGAVDLQIRSRQLQMNRGHGPLGPPLNLHNLGKGELGCGGAAAASGGAVQQSHSKHALKHQLAAHHLGLSHRAQNPAGQQLRRALPSRREADLLREGVVLFSKMGHQDGVLLLLPLFNLQAVVPLHICAEAQGTPLKTGDPGNQLAVGKDLPGIQHPGFQKLDFRIGQQVHAPCQASAVALGGKGHGKFQYPDAALPLWGVQHRHPYRAGDLRLAVPQLPAVQKDLALCFDDPGNIRAVVRYNGLRGFLLGQRQLTACLIGVQTGCFQF